MQFFCKIICSYQKKAVPLHRFSAEQDFLHDANGKHDRLFSSVGQSTWFVISGSLVRIRQEAQERNMNFEIMV